MHRTARSTVALTVAIVAWSLAPLWVINSTGLAPAPVVALFAVILATVLAVGLTAWSRAYNVVAAYQSVRDSGLFLPAAGVGLLAFVVYPLLYFSAIQTGPALLVNLVNYLWPIIGLVLVAVARREAGSLELLLAGTFGFGGAALAILSGTHGGAGIGAATSVLPFALAVIGAVAYGGVSAFMSIYAPDERSPSRISFFVIALCIGGVVCVAILAIVAAFDYSLVVPEVTAPRLAALLVYSLLYPFSHFSWLTAVQDRRIPGFASAFLVPVLATVTLAVAARDPLGPEIISALTLVLCGILFSAARERGVPVAFAVTLAATGSIQVSESMPVSAAGAIADDFSTFVEVLVGLVAIFGGFVLTNSIARYVRLQGACEAVYRRARRLRDHESTPDVEADLDLLDRTILSRARPGRLGSEDRRPTVTRNLHPGLTREWVQVDMALANQVSRYEWLVLMLGGGGVMLSLHFAALESSSFVVSVVRAIATAVVVGVLFAVRDYDLNRPDRVVDNLLILRRRFEFPPAPGTALGEYLDKSGRSKVDWMALALTVLVFLSMTSIVLNVR